MPRAYLPELNPTIQRNQELRYRGLDDRIDHEPHMMLTLDNTKTSNRTVPTCSFAPTCFECPLSQCKYDMDISSYALTYALRQKKLIIKIGHLHEYGLTSCRISEILSIPSRNVYRWVEKELWKVFREWSS